MTRSKGRVELLHHNSVWVVDVQQYFAKLGASFRVQARNVQLERHHRRKLAMLLSVYPDLGGGDTDIEGFDYTLR